MSTNAVAVLTNSINSDTSATPTTLVQRDATGGILAATVTGSVLQSTGNIQGAVVNKTANFSAASATIYTVDATSGAVAVGFPTASANMGVIYKLIKTDSSGHAVTLTSVLGVGSLSSQYSSATVFSDGSNWYGV